MSTLDIKDVRWRISNTWDKGSVKWGMLVGYIDSRTAMEALDTLDANWSSRMEPITLNGQAGVRCTLTVNGVSREDVGVPSNTEPLKGAFSDALKRAAVHFGIGRELYELPKIGVECEVDRNGKAKGPKALPEYKDGRWTIDRKLGWVRYDREPEDEQPGQGERTGSSEAKPRASATTPAPAQYRRDELIALMREKHLDLKAVEDYAALIGIKVGEQATNEQMDRLIEAVRGHGTDAVIESAPAEEEAGSAHPAEPPKPRSEEYKALPAPEKAAARAYWESKEAEERQPEPINPEQEPLGMAL